MSIDPRSPLFISYRQSDGTPIAVDLAWALRAAGVPVWHDRTDLPPGDTRQRLGEALDAGLSGAVLLVTPEIARSAVIREVELPRLLELEAADAAFTLSVASTVGSATGRLDYTAPDRLLEREPGTLSRLDQQPASTPTERARIAASQCRRRMEHLRPSVEANGRTLILDVQTRVPPFAATVDADLVLRLRPPADGQRRPSREGLEDLRHFLAELPQLVSIAGAQHVQVRGGAHLSVACALGAALPTTLVGRTQALDTSGAVWAMSGDAPARSEDPRIGVVDADTGEAERGPVLLYVDLLPERSDAAVEDFRAANTGKFAGYVHLRPLRDELLDPRDAAGVVGEIRHAIRVLAGAHRTTEVHLLLRCPYTIALLMGRTLNTLVAHLYEWENGDGPDGLSGQARYLPSLVLRSGTGGSPIRSVTLPPGSTPESSS